MQNAARFQLGEFYLSQRKGSATYYATWFDKSSRQTKRKSLGTSDLESAKIALIEFEMLHREAKSQPRKDTSIGLVFTRYYEKTAKNLASATSARRSLALILKNLPDDSSVDDYSLETQKRVATKLRDLGLANGTIKRAMGVGKAAIRHAWQNGELDGDIPFLSLPDGNPRDRVLTVSELKALWQADMPTHMRTFLRLLIGTAARPGAILELTAEQCDLTQGTINLNPKGRSQTKKRRPILPIPDCIRAELEARKVGHFVQWRGKPITKINKTWRSVRKNAGLSPDVTPYTIRHTIATEMRKRGVSELEMAGYLGHSMPNFRTTGRYAHVSPDYLRAAADSIDDLAREIGMLPTVQPIDLRANRVPSRRRRISRVTNSRLYSFNKIGAGDERQIDLKIQ